jgi:hypothetical protein
MPARARGWDTQGEVVAQGRGAGVAGRDMQVGEVGGLAQLPGDGVLAAAAANQE